MLLTHFDPTVGVDDVNTEPLIESMERQGSVAASNGSSLQNDSGGDASQMTVNGELHKVAHNICFGHGIHGSIHWRSDTDTSIQLGEAVALSVLRNRAHTYNEKFSVQLTKVDGTKATISNQ